MSKDNVENECETAAADTAALTVSQLKTEKQQQMRSCDLVGAQTHSDRESLVAVFAALADLRPRGKCSLAPPIPGSTAEAQMSSIQYSIQLVITARTIRPNRLVLD